MNKCDKVVEDADILINRLRSEDIQNLGTVKAIERLKDSISVYNRSK